MKDNQKKYEEAAKEYVQWNNLKIPGEADGQAAFRIWMAGASFAEKEANNNAIDKAIDMCLVFNQRSELIERLEKMKI